MLKIVISLLFSLLIMAVAGQEDYASSAKSISHTPTSSYRQSQSPCKRTMDFIFTHRFADMPQAVLSLDNPDSSKSKCVLRLLASLNEFRKQELQTTHIDHHLLSSHYPHAVDYYIYALRRIII
ncbi:hypothetical protein [Phocaeicola sp.]